MAHHNSSVLCLSLVCITVYLLCYSLKFSHIKENWSRRRCSCTPFLQACTEIYLTHRCLFGWNLSSFPFSFFSFCHSLHVIQPFLPQSLKLSCAGSARVCGWKDASTSSLSSVLSFCFSPKTSSSLSQLHSVPFPQVKFPTPSPSLSLVYHSHPPPLPACCFPREVNLLSAGSMNSIGLELRPTRFPNIAHVFCIASACQNPSSSIYSAVIVLQHLVSKKSCAIPEYF